MTSGPNLDFCAFDQRFINHFSLAPTARSASSWISKALSTTTSCFINMETNRQNRCLRSNESTSIVNHIILWETLRMRIRHERDAKKIWSVGRGGSMGKCSGSLSEAGIGLLWQSSRHRGSLRRFIITIPSSSLASTVNHILSFEQKSVVFSSVIGVY